MQTERLLRKYYVEDELQNGGCQSYLGGEDSFWKWSPARGR